MQSANLYNNTNGAWLGNIGESKLAPARLRDLQEGVAGHVLSEKRAETR